ncbi:MAG: hypothetical protein ACYS8W_11775 [Planctomycetota bacterium]|jgi:hypothetical protein
MESSLSLKLVIFIIVLFGLVILGMLMSWPIQIRYYTHCLDSKDMKQRQNAADKLLEWDIEEPVCEYYANRYQSDDVMERMAVVDEFGSVSEKGRAIMESLFRARCRKEQVLIPAGTLILENGDKVEIEGLYIDYNVVTREKEYSFMRLKFVYDLCLDGTRIRTPEGKFAVNSASMQWFEARRYAEWLDMRLPSKAELDYIMLYDRSIEPDLRLEKARKVISNSTNHYLVRKGLVLYSDENNSCVIDNLSNPRTKGKYPKDYPYPTHFRCVRDVE